MTELTTGVLLLVSSLYGSVGADNHVANIVSANTTSTPVREERVEQKKIFTTNDPKEMEKYLRDKFAEEPILVDIARCESSFRQFDKDGTVIRGKANKADIGVMQINEKYHAEKAVELGFDLSTIDGNTAYARYLYNREGTKPWKASEPCWSVGNTLAKAN